MTFGIILLNNNGLVMKHHQKLVYRWFQEVKMVPAIWTMIFVKTVHQLLFQEMLIFCRNNWPTWNIADNDSASSHMASQTINHLKRKKTSNECHITLIALIYYSITYSCSLRCKIKCGVGQRIIWHKAVETYKSYVLDILAEWKKVFVVSSYAKVNFKPWWNDVFFKQP